MKRFVAGVDRSSILPQRRPAALRSFQGGTAESVQRRDGMDLIDHLSSRDFRKRCPKYSRD